MRVAAFSIKPYDTSSLAAASVGLPIEWAWFEPRLDRHTARLAEGAVAINCFVNDQLDAATLAILAEQGVKLVTLRCAGFNQVDLAAAARLSLPVVRVPEYSPHAVAEHTIGLVLTLDRTAAKTRDLDVIRDIIWQNPGSRRVILRVTGGEKPLRIIPADEFRVNPEAEAKLAAWIVARERREF